MDLNKIARRVASSRTASVAELQTVLGQHENMSEVLENLVTAAKANVDYAEKDGVDVEALGLMAEQADVLEAAITAVLPRIKKLDAAILAAL